MEKSKTCSKVYFTDFRTGLGVSLPAKLQKLILDQTMQRQLLI